MRSPWLGKYSYADSSLLLKAKSNPMAATQGRPCRGSDLDGPLVLRTCSPGNSQATLDVNCGLRGWRNTRPWRDSGLNGPLFLRACSPATRQAIQYVKRGLRGQKAENYSYAGQCLLLKSQAKQT